MINSRFLIKNLIPEKVKYILSPLFIFIIFLLAACSELISLDSMRPDPKIVMNCGIIPDSSIVVNITKSMFKYDSLYYVGSRSNVLKDAEVSIYINGEFREKMEPSNAERFPTHISHTKVQPGDMVMLKASHSGFEDAWAEVVVPHAVPLISVDTISYPSQNDYYPGYYPGNYPGYSAFYNNYKGIRVMRTYIKFRDVDVQKRNYYALTIKRKFEVLGIDSFAGEVFVDPLAYNYEQDPALYGGIKTDINSLFSEYYRGSTYVRAFSDELFNGKEYTINVSFTTGRTDSIWIYNMDKTYQDTSYWNGEMYISTNYEIEGYAMKTEYELNLLTLSEDYYLYMKSRDAYNEDDGLSEIGLTEPIRIHTNVKGGIGIVGAYQPSSLSVKMY